MNDLIMVASRLSVNRNEEHQLHACVADFPCSSLAVPCLLAGTSDVHQRFYPTCKIDELRLSQWMSQPVILNNFDLDHHVPKLILNSWVSNFIDIVQQRRIRLVKNSRRFLASSQDPDVSTDSRMATLKVLSKSSVFKFSEAVTRCRPSSRKRMPVSRDNNGSGLLALPITFSLKITVTIMGTQTINTIITVPGTLEGTFVQNQPNLLGHVDLCIDTCSLCKAMKDRATDLVERADAIACADHRRRTKTTKLPEFVVIASKYPRAASVSLVPSDATEAQHDLKPAVRSARCA